jgi:uncharacterized phage protein (TIGR01671 family)
MRTIKFRGKRLGDNKWVYGSLISDKEKGVGIMQQRENPMHDGVAQGWCHGIQPETVGQFTGLQDKNGKDIYEGDLVQHDDWNYPFEVIFNDEKARFVCKLQTGLTQYIDYQRLEVIGNIHENKGGGNE